MTDHVSSDLSTSTVSGSVDSRNWPVGVCICSADDGGGVGAVAEGSGEGMPGLGVETGVEVWGPVNAVS